MLGLCMGILWLSVIYLFWRYPVLAVGWSDCRHTLRGDYDSAIWASVMSRPRVTGRRTRTIRTPSHYSAERKYGINLSKKRSVARITGPDRIA